MKRSTPYSKDGRQDMPPEFNVYKRVDFSTVETRSENHTCLVTGFVNALVDVRRE